MSVAITRTVALKAIHAYKHAVSPWLPAACRFSPTCSEYAFEAIERYGLLAGLVRALLRLLRCHPLHRGGFDPLT
jgi:putative membrane protein insertion efficiency factor